MAKPVPTSGDENDHGARTGTTHPIPCARGRWSACLAVALAVNVCAPFAVMAGGEAGSDRAGLHRRALSEDEISALWEGRTSPNAAHRSYIFIDEEEIVEGTELPLFRVEASRYGGLRQLERMAKGDAGLAARIADLAPELARETEMSRRADAAFYSRRSCAARRDTPESPGLVTFGVRR